MSSKYKVVQSDKRAGRTDNQAVVKRKAIPLCHIQTQLMGFDRQRSNITNGTDTNPLFPPLMPYILLEILEPFFLPIRASLSECFQAICRVPTDCIPLVVEFLCILANDKSMLFHLSQLFTQCPVGDAPQLTL
jgi:hypothetical protein